MNIAFSLVLGLMLTSTSLQSRAAEIKTDFLGLCSRVTINEKLFTGKCQLYPPDVFDKNLNISLEIIKASDPELTIDKLFRDKLLVDSTKYFRDKYTLNSSYTSSLDQFVVELENLGDVLLNKIDNVKIKNFSEAYSSTINPTVYEINTEKENSLANEKLTDEEYQELKKELECANGLGFCKAAEEMFGIDTTDKWRDYTISEALLDALNNAVEYFNKKAPVYSDTVAQDKNLIKRFLENLKKQGTSLPIKELQEVIETKLFKMIVLGFDYNYEFKTTTIRPETTKEVNKNTTKWQKIILEPLVSNSVAYGVPGGILAMGILGAVILVVFRYYFKPAINIANMNEIDVNDNNIPLKRI